MRNYVIDTFGLFEPFRNKEDLFDFYPSGVSGVIGDYVAYHFHHPKPTDNSDNKFIDQVFQAYYESSLCHFVFATREERDRVMEDVLVTLLAINQVCQQYVKEHRSQLMPYDLQAHAMAMGINLEYLLLEPC